MNWPEGFTAGVAACGIKPTGLDMGMIVADEPCAWAGVFTQNAAAAAPVRWSRSLLGSSLRAIVVNSGNANACTGRAGDAVVEATGRSAAHHVGCDAAAVGIASTGPIGVELPETLVLPGVATCALDLTARPLEFALSIMTTDTGPKLAEATCGTARVVGIAKGAAMIAPNMATMLAFIVTDAGTDEASLQEILSAATDETFNRISIDGCESTNDSVFAIASGVHEVPEGELRTAIQDVCADLALQICSDAEGSTRLLRITIEGAESTSAAVALGKAVAGSALWRAAVGGADPNWGRIAAALGSSDPGLDLSELEIWIGAEQVFSHGEACGSLEAAAKQMQSDAVEVFCRVGRGSARAEVLSAELSTDYVALNAAGTT